MSRLATSPTELTTKYAAAFFRHKTKVALFFLVVMGSVTAVTFFWPRVYRSEAKLFLRLGRENVTLDPIATLAQTPVVAIPATRDQEINSVIEMLKSHGLLERVVARVGPDAILGKGPARQGETEQAEAHADKRTPRPTAAGLRRSPWPEPPLPGDDRYRATAKLARMLTVEAIKKSNIIRIACDGPSPEVARAIVSALVDLYQAQHVHLNRTPGAYSFLREQTARLRGELTRAEEKLRKVQGSTGLTSPEAQRQTLVTRLARLEDELLQAEAGVAAGKATTRLLRATLATLPRTHLTALTKGFPNTAADTMRAQLYALQIRAKEIGDKYPEGHPEVRRIQKQVKAARALLAREEKAREQVTTGPNKVHEDVQSTLLREEPLLAALEARAEVLRAQLARERTRLKQFNRDQLAVARLKREVDLQEAHYRKYADNLEQVQIDSALESEKLSNISVVQPATFDARPIQPRWLVNLGLGFLAALLGGVGLVMLLEARDRSLKTPEDGPQRLGLASVPELASGALTRNGPS
jgi:uncharacterized protein involved in exopolysaccharide biosynthesis